VPSFQACAGFIVVMFMGIMGLFAIDIINNKILSPNRKYRYGNQF
jgi:hypothetical protein